MILSALSTMLGVRMHLYCAPSANPASASNQSRQISARLNSEGTDVFEMSFYLLLCKLEPNQCNIDERHKHRIGWLNVDERSIRMEIVVYKS